MMHLPVTIPEIAAGVALIATAIGAFFAVRYWRTKPTSYFTRWLSPEQMALLQSANIAMQEAVSLDGEEGVLFEARYLGRVKSALDASVESAHPWPIADKNVRISEIVLAASPFREAANDRYGVTFDRRSIRSVKQHLLQARSRRAVVRLVRKLVTPVALSDIVVHQPRYDNATLIHDNKFHIFVPAVSHYVGDAKVPDELWGIPMLDRPYSYAPSGRGIPLYDEVTGYFFAELVDNCLFIHTDIFNANKKVRWGLLTRMLQRANREISAAKVVEDSFAAMPGEGLYALDLEGHRDRSVAFDDMSGRRAAVLKPILQRLLVPAVGKDVVVHDGKGGNRVAIDDGKFHVHLYASPQGKPAVAVPAKLWETSLFEPGQAFLPSGVGVPIMEPSGYCAAELSENNLFINSDLLRFGSKPECIAFGNLLLAVVKDMREGRSVAEAHFVSECMRQANNFTGNGDTATHEAWVRHSREQLAKLLKSTHNAEENYELLAAAPEEELGREYDQLVNIPKVLDVDVNEKGIVVHTDVLYCLDPRTQVRHEIGAFEIHIPTNGQAVTWHNKTRQVEGYNGRLFNAPHVDGKGYGCLGNTQDLFPTLLRNRQFAEAIVLAITFVESVNVDDSWGRYIQYWPKASQQARGGAR